MKNNYAVIIAGGKGERFWPESRIKTPKHLLPIVGNKPMLSQTIERLSGFIAQENILIITNKTQKPDILKLHPELSPSQVVAEPIGRNTAAAIGLAMILVRAKDPQGAFCVLPADHVIKDKQAFQNTLRQSFELALTEDSLITLGIPPTYPATGYGYIHKGIQRESTQANEVCQVKCFVEKPELELAQKYIDSGNYYWNAGCFIFSVTSIDSALKEHMPRLHQGLQVISEQYTQNQDLDKVLEEHYATLESQSIDYGVLEHASNIIVVKASFDWDDVGSWSAIANHFPQDKDGNTIQGQAIQEDAKSNTVISRNNHLIAALGVQDLIIVHTPEATLICDKNRSQEVKKLVKSIEADPDLQYLL